MRKNISSVWKTILLLSMVFFMGSAEILAKPPAPIITVIQPYYNDNGSPKMYVRWDRVWGGREYQYQRKVEGGTYGDWILSDPDAPAVSIIDEIEPEKRYTYRVRVRVGQEWSNPSASRSNKAARVWPVTKGDCSAEESIGLLHGFNQVHRARGTHPYPHEGIDLRDEIDIPRDYDQDGECVRAPVGGILTLIVGENAPSDYERGLLLEYHLNGKDYCISFNHLKYNRSLNPQTSVEPGDYLGTISTQGTFFIDEQHIHIGLDEDDSTGSNRKARNPLEIWNNPVYRDPGGTPPRVQAINTASLDGPVRFRKGPNETTYLPNTENVYGAIDIVVEARDHQTANLLDTAFHPPLKIGYYIQKIDGTTITDVVQSANLSMDFFVKKKDFTSLQKNRSLTKA